MGSVVTNIYGVNQSDAVSYPIGRVAAGDDIVASKWVELRNNINAERSRRGFGGVPDTGLYDIIEVQDLNTLSSYINYYWSDGYVDSSTTVAAGHINYIIDKIQYCGSICVCNCNYCTCNCNYCTCNCNYSCTCNCNYSDERMKDNIKFIGIEHGIKMYTWNYKWDTTKTYTGVIAQDLIGTEYESALSQDTEGFYVVDYSKLPVKMKG
jgi:hypothetical protein